MNHRIETAHLFPRLNAELDALLLDLTPTEWAARTHFDTWTVKDIAAHLLDTSLRRLSAQRDGFRGPQSQSLESDNDLIRLITDQADRWAEALAFVSPAILRELIARYQRELADFFQTLDPEAESPIPVGWAGETRSQNWFDVAREYTERWHHQMQIREALGRPPLLTRELSFPVLDTFLCALPYHYRNIDRPAGTVLEVNIEGEAGGRWFLEWQGQERLLLRVFEGRVSSRVALDQSVAWKLFTRFYRTVPASRVQMAGDDELGRHLLSLTCIMAESRSREPLHVLEVLVVDDVLRPVLHVEVGPSDNVLSLVARTGSEPRFLGTITDRSAETLVQSTILVFQSGRAVAGGRAIPVEPSILDAVARLGPQSYFATARDDALPVTMEYWRQRRRHIGHALLFTPAAGALVQDEQGRILLQRRTDDGTWGILGGSLEIGESPEEAAVREVREESGLTVRLERLLSVATGEDCRVHYPNGDRLQFWGFLFLARVVGGRELPDPTETAELRWFSPREIDGLTPLNLYARMNLRNLHHQSPKVFALKHGVDF